MLIAEYLVSTDVESIGVRKLSFYNHLLSMDVNRQGNFGGCMIHDMCIAFPQIV